MALYHQMKKTKSLASQITGSFTREISAQNFPLKLMTILRPKDANVDTLFGLYRLKLLVLTIVFAGAIFSVEAQDKAEVGINSEAFRQPVDSLAKEEFAPLDIEADRGLYIQTKDQKMQLRILGSIRFLVLNDFVNIPIKKTFNSYFIPIGDDRVYVPNYYSDLAQTRFGFEVLRKINDRELFTRLEMDFSGGTNNQFRIRHAYGKYNKFIIGQTWSLFSNVTALPTTVSADGPTGSVILRTPQIRYFDSDKQGTRWAVALEYSRPDLNLSQVDSSRTSVVQLVPDITARFEKEGRFGHWQLSAVVNTLSVLDEENQITNVFGIGGSLTGTFDFPTSKILYQLTYGQSIAHYITTFSGTGNDATLNPTTGAIDPNWAFGGFLGYDYNWTDKISSNIVLGYASLENRDFQPEHAYADSYSLAINNFWKIVDGAKLGMEYTHAKRNNRGGQSGDAHRISFLFYYDF